MAKKSPQPVVEITSRQARLMLFGLLRDFVGGFGGMERSALSRQVLPWAERHGFAHDASSRQLSEEIKSWFGNLPEGEQVRTFKILIENVLSGEDLARKKILTKVLARFHLKFAYGGFISTQVELKEYLTPFRNYKVGRKLGQGGVGSVWEADSDGERFALKAISKNDGPSAKRKRFTNEMWACAKLDHPNIVGVVDWGLSTIRGDPFYVMRAYDGSLRDLIKEGLAPSRVLPLFMSALDGVEFAHAKQVWHRDIKPENLLYRKEPEGLVVSDFGIAHFHDELLKIGVNTEKGELLANRDYAAPEQRKRGGTVNHCADVFALGLVLNEMFTGSLPLGQNYKRIATVSSDHAALDELVLKMTEADPERRITIAGIRDQLGRYSK